MSYPRTGELYVSEHWQIHLSAQLILSVVWKKKKRKLWSWLFWFLVGFLISPNSSLIIEAIDALMVNTRLGVAEGSVTLPFRIHCFLNVFTCFLVAHAHQQELLMIIILQSCHSDHVQSVFHKTSKVFIRWCTAVLGSWLAWLWEVWWFDGCRKSAYGIIICMLDHSIRAAKLIKQVGRSKARRGALRSCCNNVDMLLERRLKQHCEKSWEINN